MLKGTSFHSRTSVLCQAQNWRRWSGYLAASSYELTHDREYYAIRNSAALIDISPLFKYMVSGPDAGRLLNRVMTRDIAQCAVNQVMYTPWCDAHGKVIDDGTVARLGDDTFRVTSADPNYRWFHDSAFGLRARIKAVSDAIAALALQGPNSREILQQAAGASLEGLKYFRSLPARIRDVPVTISRTGYTGDLGYEIWVGAEHAESLWDTLIDVGAPYGITPAGMLALDLARLEAGLLLIEVDYYSSFKALIESRKSSPLELGLGWTVDLDKENFIGKKAIAAEKQRGPAWQFVGLEVEWDSLERVYAEAGLPPQIPTVAWRTSVPVYSNGGQIGYATSGCWSPILKKYIVLAHLRSEYARPGTPVTMEVTAEHQRKRASAQVVKTPFFDLERKRK